MKLTRSYRVLPDRGICLQPGCSWHREGDTAETFGEAHATMTGHEVQVQSASTVVFNSRREVAARA